MGRYIDVYYLIVVKMNWHFLFSSLERIQKIIQRQVIILNSELLPFHTCFLLADGRRSDIIDGGKVFRADPAFQQATEGDVFCTE